MRWGLPQVQNVNLFRRIESSFFRMDIGKEVKRNKIACLHLGLAGARTAEASNQYDNVG